MTIPIVCPHCNETFQLSPDLIGKSIRCPNRDCEEVFEVRSSAPAAPPAAEPELEAVEELTLDTDGAPAEPLAVEPEEAPVAGQVSDFLTVVEGESAEPAPRPVAEKMPVASFLPPAQTAARIPTASLLGDKSARAPVAAKAGPKEVVWSGADAPPGAPPAAPIPSPVGLPPPARPDRDDSEPFIRTRRRRSNATLILGLIVGAIALAGIGIAVGVVRNIVLTEERMAEEAKTAYDDGNYPVAQKKYEELIAQYSGSDRLDEYKFFASLSETRVVVGSVTARENPGPSVKRFERFVEEFGSTPLAQPERGYGSDIVQTGQRVVDTVADHGADRLEDFRRDREKNGEGLTTAEQAVAEGRRLLPVVEKFRDKDGISLEPQRKRFDELQAKISFEKHRLEVLAPFRDIDRDPTSEIIGRFRAVLHENNLADDAEAIRMLASAESALRARIGIRRENRPASQPPADAAPPVLFSAAVAGSPEPRPSPDVPLDVVFSVGRGILYALDSHTGGLLWGTRVAVPNADPNSIDLPVRVPIGDGGAEWVLVVGEYAGVPGITARVARTGEPVWYQPLTAASLSGERSPAAAMARPLVVGTHVYVPLRDPLGTVSEFELFTGTRTGDLTVRQPLGGGLAVLPGGAPGVDLLLVPGDAQRVFVFERGREDAAGRHLDPKLVRVLQTDHPRDSLRGEPVTVTPADVNGPRYLILCQADGPTGMKLRAFPLPPPDVLAADHGGGDPPTPRPAEVPVPGWSWFPPVSNGERVVLTTDAGAFLPFGVNQIGNADRPLFTLPGPKTPTEQEGVSRSQVVAADEDAYWVVLGGQLIRLRTAVDPRGGLRIIPQGSGRPVGDPVHRAQVRRAVGLGVVVSRAGAGGNVQAVGFDLGTGQVRWQRRLGATPAGPPVAQGPGAWVVATDDGGVYAVNPKDPAAGTAAASVVASVVAPPFAELSGRAFVAASPDGKRTWVLAAEKDSTGRRLRVRLVADGALKQDSIVPLPDELAGNPMPLGDTVLLPLANGYLYRYVGGADQLAVGPLWRGGASGPGMVCHLGPAGTDEFLATDGARKFLRWKWPAGAEAKADKTGGPWELRANIAVAPAVVRTGDTTRVVAADVGGAVLLFDLDSAGEPVRRWYGSADGPIPPGTPTGRIATLTAGQQTLLVYVVDNRHVVAVDPSAAESAWVARDLAPPESGLSGWAVDGGRVVTTDLIGTVTVLDGATGSPVTVVAPPPGSAVAAGPAVPAGDARGLMLLDDGSGTVVALTSPASPPKKK